MSTKIASISKRELQILKLVSFEYCSKEIAQLLYISKSTVTTHRKNLMAKLKVKNTAGLIRRGFELDYLELLKDTDPAFSES